MAAKDSLGGQFWGPGGMMFHISPVENRAGIEKEGLRAKPPVGFMDEQKVDVNAPGVFVSEEPLRFNDDFDVYAVDTQNLPSVIDDKNGIDRFHGSRFVPGSIPPNRVQRITGEDRDKVVKWRASGGHRHENPFQG
jgi:hypothetical protein